MKKPEDFPKALYALQIADTTLYLIVGVVVYAYTGADAISPALGNTGTTLRKIAYGIALPTIMIAGVIKSMVAGQHLASRFNYTIEKRLYQKCLRLRGLDSDSISRALGTPAHSS